MRTEERDVLVIGAGAAGGAITWSLAGRGADVLCLEQGDWVRPELLPRTHVDWEVRARRYWSPSPNIRRWPSDYPVTQLGRDPVNVFLYNAVGGSTVGFAGNYWRFAPSDFRVATLDNVAVDWPLTYEELAPFYTMNERLVGVAGLAGDPWSPPRDPLPLPPAPIGETGRLLVQGFRRLGWQWWPTEQSIATRPYNGRPACDFRNFCTKGCVSGALGSADVTYWRRMTGSRRGNAELRTNARVREVTLRPNGRARGVLYYDAAGQLREVRAKVVVIACGGIGTPRLLLSSRSCQQPDGLANRSGMVGKNLMVHIQSYAIGCFEEPLDGWQGTWGGTVSTRQFYETDSSRGYTRGFIMSGTPGWSPLSLALEVVPWGPGHHAVMRDYLNHQMGVYLCGEDLPSEKNRVELDWANVDDFGMPGVTTYYELDENGRRLGTDMLRHGRMVLEAAGARQVHDIGLSPMVGWHLLGTARMGRDAATSVVDGNNRAHDVPNVFIADSSSFPTSGGVNPTSTIQALALRCGAHIWETRGEWT